MLGRRECSECRMILIFLPCHSKWIQRGKATYEEALLWGRDDDFNIFILECLCKLQKKISEYSWIYESYKPGRSLVVHENLTP